MGAEASAAAASSSVVSASPMSDAALGEGDAVAISTWLKGLERDEEVPGEDVAMSRRAERRSGVDRVVESCNFSRILLRFDLGVTSSSSSSPSNEAGGILLVGGVGSKSLNGEELSALASPKGCEDDSGVAWGGAFLRVLLGCACDP